MTVAKLLSRDLKTSALKLLSHVSLAGDTSERSQMKPASARETAAKSENESSSDEFEAAWKEDCVGSTAALKDLVNRGFVSPDFALSLISLSASSVSRGMGVLCLAITLQTT